MATKGLRATLAAFLLLGGCGQKGPVPAAPKSSELTDPKTWDCREQPYCPEIETCFEAQYRLKVCGLGRLDADDDGIACELTCSDQRQAVIDTAEDGGAESDYFDRLAVVASQNDGVEALSWTHDGDPVELAFRGYPCESDCAGHIAGYDWASEHDYADVADCEGVALSGSFIEGCIAWVDNLGSND